jgi:lysozyme
VNVYDLIRADEGLRLTVYDDATGDPIGPGSVVKGHPTIGYGRCLDSRHGITQGEADTFLYADVDQWEIELKQAFRWFTRLNEPRQAVLVSMAHQMGIDGLKRFGNALEAMQSGAWEIAAQELFRSKWARQTPARAKRLANIMRTGAYGE